MFGSVKRYWVLWLVAISVTWVNFNQERWLKFDVIQHDVRQYYSYLPALFYHHDLKLSFLGNRSNQNSETAKYAPVYTAEGQPLIKMSLGMAVTYLPYFLLARVYAHIAGFPDNGFSEPFQFAVQFSSLVYYLLGLVFLNKALRRYFPEKSVALTLFFVTIGTNAFYYLTLGAGMSHPVGFFLYSALIFFTDRWYRDTKLGDVAAIGIIIGFMTLVRPINVLGTVFFGIYGIRSLADLKGRFRFLVKQWLQISLIALICFLIFVPQMLYWRFTTNSFLFNSYIGEGFYFSKPHILRALFGFRKGWLVYTPIMAFSLFGIYTLWRTGKMFFYSVFLLFLIYIYVAFSWWCWWYGGSFGQRVLIDIYPVLSLAFCAFMTNLLLLSKHWRFAFYSFAGALTLLNLFQTMQAKYNILHYDSMTKESYFRIFFTITGKPDKEKYLKHPDYERALRGEEE